MHFEGLIIAVVSFIIIGVFHPVVIKSEYYFGIRCWPAFALAGAVAIGFALFVESVMISAILGVLGCTFFWCIVELFHQKRRVEKGWFPKNPNRRY